MADQGNSKVPEFWIKSAKVELVCWIACLSFFAWLLISLFSENWVNGALWILVTALSILMLVFCMSRTKWYLWLYGLWIILLSVSTLIPKTHDMNPTLILFIAGVCFIAYIVVICLYSLLEILKIKVERSVKRKKRLQNIRRIKKELAAKDRELARELAEKDKELEREEKEIERREKPFELEKRRKAVEELERKQKEDD